MNPTLDSRDRKKGSGAQQEAPQPGSGLGARSAILCTVLLLLVGIAGYAGTWAAMGRFAVVDPGRLYRSAETTPKRLVQECKRLGIRTVVDFRMDSPKVDAEAKALEEVGVRHAHLPTEQVPRPETVNAFLEIMSHAENLPVLIHCQHGVGRTGLHAAVYRMEFQGWSNECARLEAMLLAGFDSFQKDTDKGRFIESYTPRLRRQQGLDSSTHSQ